MPDPRPRLAIQPSRRVLREPEKHLHAVDEWVRTFAGTFPPEGRVLEHWHLPADQRLVDRPTAHRKHQTRCAQALIDVAEHLITARPEAQAHHPVIAAIFWPDMFMSEVDVFFDRDYFLSFEKRDDKNQRWIRMPRDRSLARELELRVPQAFYERGYLQQVRSFPTGKQHVAESEVWIIGEIAD